MIKSYNLSALLNGTPWNVTVMGRTDFSNNPSAMLVSVSPYSRSNWIPVRKLIIAILDGYELWNVAIYILPDRSIQSVKCPTQIHEYPLPDTACQQKAQAGLSFGSSSADGGFGALGGFVELQWGGRNWEEVRYLLPLRLSTIHTGSIP